MSDEASERDGLLQVDREITDAIYYRVRLKNFAVLLCLTRSMPRSRQKRDSIGLQLRVSPAPSAAG